jgi:hypothetical protein
VLGCFLDFIWIFEKKTRRNMSGSSQEQIGTNVQHSEISGYNDDTDWDMSSKSSSILSFDKLQKAAKQASAWFGMSLVPSQEDARKSNKTQKQIRRRNSVDSRTASATCSIIASPGKDKGKENLKNKKSQLSINNNESDIEMSSVEPEIYPTELIITDSLRKKRTIHNNDDDDQIPIIMQDDNDENDLKQKEDEDTEIEDLIPIVQEEEITFEKEEELAVADELGEVEEEQEICETFVQEERHESDNNNDDDDNDVPIAEGAGEREEDIVSMDDVNQNMLLPENNEQELVENKEEQDGEEETQNKSKKRKKRKKNKHTISDEEQDTDPESFSVKKHKKKKNKKKKNKKKKHKKHGDDITQPVIADYFHREHGAIFDAIDKQDEIYSSGLGQQQQQQQQNQQEDLLGGDEDLKHNEEDKTDLLPPERGYEDEEEHEDKKEETMEQVKKSSEQRVKELCKALRGTLLTAKTSPHILYKWFLGCKKILSANFIRFSQYYIFTNEVPAEVSQLYLHNICILKEIDFLYISECFQKDNNVDDKKTIQEQKIVAREQLTEIKFRSEIIELIRSWNSVIHVGNVLFATEVRKRNGQVIQLPPLEDYMPTEFADVLKPDQKLMTFLYGCAEKKDYRRDEHNNVYAPYTTEEGDYTFYYKRKCTLQEFIAEAVMPKELHPEEYDIYTDKNHTPRHMFQMLSQLPDPRFPILKRNPSLFAFSNGLLDITGNKEKGNDPMTFYEYKDTGRKRGKKGWLGIESLPKNSIACNFIKGQVKRELWPTIESEKAAKLEKDELEKYNEQFQKTKKTSPIEDVKINSANLPIDVDEEEKHYVEEDDMKTPSDFAEHANRVRAQASHRRDMEGDNGERIRGKETRGTAADAMHVPRFGGVATKKRQRELRVEQKRLVNLLTKHPVWNIFKNQKWEEEDVYWFGAFMGRMIARKDGLENAPYLRGVGGSGKSTILKLVLAMLDPMDVTLIQDDGRKNFSDQHIIGKRIVAAMDIGTKPNFSKTKLNSYLSKEPLLTDKLYEVSMTQMEVECNWMLAGNGEPPWSDLSGCIARRLLIFLFATMIKKTDTTLFARCLEQLPTLLVIFQFMYIDMMKFLDGRTVWDPDHDKTPILSNMLHQSKQSFLVSSSSLSSFLEDCDWCINKDNDTKNEITKANTISEINFNTAYKKWLNINGVKEGRKKINVIEDAPILKCYGIEMTAGVTANSGMLSGLMLGPSANCGGGGGVTYGSTSTGNYLRSHLGSYKEPRQSTSATSSAA